MRITQGMMSNNMLNNLSKSYQNLDKYMNQLNTGKKINRPSDDPVIAMKGMNYRSQVTEVEQFERNTNEVHNWMDNSDASLDEATKALQKLRELAVQASNSTYGSEERKSIQEETEQLKQHLIDVANTNVNGKYIFNGTNTGKPPVKKDEDGKWSFTNSPIEPVNIEVFHGTKIQANVDGKEIFGGDFFGNIEGFIDELGKTDGDIDKSISKMDENINNVVNARANLGARMNRLDLIENRLSEQKIVANKTMAENEDVDYEVAITNLLTEESMLRASLAAGSRIIQPSLMDFLR